THLRIVKHLDIHIGRFHNGIYSTDDHRSGQQSEIPGQYSDENRLRQYTPYNTGRGSTDGFSYSYFFCPFFYRDYHDITYTNYSGDQSTNPHDPQEQSNTIEQAIDFIKLFFQIKPADSTWILRCDMVASFQYRIHLTLNLADLISRL